MASRFYLACLGLKLVMHDCSMNHSFPLPHQSYKQSRRAHSFPKATFVGILILIGSCILGDNRLNSHVLIGFTQTEPISLFHPLPVLQSSSPPQAHPSFSTRRPTHTTTTATTYLSTTSGQKGQGTRDTFQQGMDAKRPSPICP